nr:MAG TPA: zinc-ribbon containing domain protein [Caudoviricetes sp.]
MNEYIDRDALRQAVLESQHDNPHPRGMAHIIHDCEHAHFVAMIARFPAADVAPVVHGRWIYHDDGVITCSECGNAESSDSYYCRYCGAKMDGGADNA